MEREAVKVRWISLFLFLLSLALAQGVLMGRASVVDGDTLEIQGVRVRLWGIDAVESSQTCLDAGGKPWPCGRRAAFALADFLGGRTVRCERRGADRYGRVVAVCHVAGVEVNRWLVEQGWALAYVEYGGKVYLEAQRQAQAARRGVWQGSFQPPWEYRKSPGAVPSAGSYSGAGKAGRCDPAYPTVCIPPPPPDLDCKDIPFRGFKVLPPDPHGFDRDGDGVGCER
jgi:endonuclease YncB( thermonuclease family)